MASVNKAILIGNLGRDPEVRHTQSGKMVVNMSVATTEKWKDGEKTEWHRIVIWDEHCGKFAESYLKKGDTVYIEGTIETRKWDDQDGNAKYTTEIVVPRFKGVLQSIRSANNGNDAKKPSGEPSNELNDEIPGWDD